jgi:hypothetical protein
MVNPPQRAGQGSGRRTEGHVFQRHLLIPMLLYSIVIFLSSFLLFQVEPIIAKIILPWFGGSAAVWATCLLFFQLELFLGYLYAHAMVRYAKPRVQAFIHALLLGASLMMLPILPRPGWRPSGSEHPAARILLLLAVTVGLPYFLLSSTSPLLQAWYARQFPDRRPYRLFSLSNAGSMLALLSYPVAVEPVLSSRHQAITWSAAYAGIAVLCGFVALRRHVSANAGAKRFTGIVRDSRISLFTDDKLRGNDYPVSSASGGGLLPTTVEPVASCRTPLTGSTEPPGPKGQLLWVALAACASALLLSVTNHLSQNVAAVPFLWVLPLSLYLLSFILCFQGSFYSRVLFLKLFAVALGSMAYAASPEFVNSSLYLLIPLYPAGLFISCMVLHGELERLKPAPQHLTLFYLMVALGGALGGVFVGLLAPAIFRGYFELPVTLGASAALIVMVLFRDPPAALEAIGRKLMWPLLAALCGALIFYLGLQVRRQLSGARVIARNFYGSLMVTDTDEPDAQHARRKLMNGTIQHGNQFLAAQRRSLATTYYGPQSGVGLALVREGRRRNIRVGVIGLGAGTLAAYGRLGDRYVFYDINPLVVRIARNWFTFLKDSHASIEIRVGDARLSLERESRQNFDILAVDAFTSDSIPVHLLTREAFLLYFHHLVPRGVLAVHISNKYLDLEPVVRGIAGSLGKHVAVIESSKNEDEGTFIATWVLVTDNAEFLQSAEVQKALTPKRYGMRPQLWTDDYSNLFRTLK